MVIFRGINVDYFDPDNKNRNRRKKITQKMGNRKKTKNNIITRTINLWKGQEQFLEAINLVNIQLGYKAFHAVILGSDQGRDVV